MIKKIIIVILLMSLLMPVSVSAYKSCRGECPDTSELLTGVSVLEGNVAVIKSDIIILNDGNTASMLSFREQFRMNSPLAGKSFIQITSSIPTVDDIPTDAEINAISNLAEAKTQLLIFADNIRALANFQKKLTAEVFRLEKFLAKANLN